MKTKSKLLFPILLAGAFGAVSAIGTCPAGLCDLGGVYAAQISRGPVAPKRDAELEKEGIHNLDVAWQYFRKKVSKSDKDALSRINKAILGRLNDIVDSNPEFSKIDEVYFLLGEVHLRDSNSEEATKWLTIVADKYPDSKFNKEARKRLATIQEPSNKKDEKNEGKIKS